MSHVYAPAGTAADPRQLAGDNLPLAYKVASTFTRRARAVGLDDEDLQQEAVVGLLQAAGAFDASLGYAFSTLAFRVIRHHLLSVLDTRRYRALQQLPVDSKGVDLPFEDQHGEAPDSAAENGDERALAQQLLRTLPPRDRTVVMLRHFEDLSLAEVGERIGLSKERVRQVEARALARMRTAAGQDEAVAAAPANAFSSASIRRPAS